MSDASYDAIVIGLGGMGSATVFELARRGRRVLGLEQFALGHDQGSSHGQTRIIRQAYYEHPDYVPLVRRAYQRWYELEQLTGRHLLTECGCLSIGRPDSSVVAGVHQSARQHGLTIEALSADDLRRRFPPFRFGDDHVGVLEGSAGFLYVDDCVRSYAAEAARLGASLHANEPVLSWQADGHGVRVETSAGRYRADRLVLTAGSWAGELLAHRGAPLKVMRQVPLWFEPSDPSQFRRDVFPIYIADTSAGLFYGFPMIDPAGAKVAQHYGAPEVEGPAQVEPTVTMADEVPVRAFLRAHLPALDGPRRRGSVCRYTLTPDRHFVIDLHPEHANVALAAGFSGHGFKFAPVVGEILADLIDTGRTVLPSERFRISRFAASSSPLPSGERGGRGLAPLPRGERGRG
jgi:sarcosine oxidase